MPGPAKQPYKLKVLRGTQNQHTTRLAAAKATPSTPTLLSPPTPPAWLSDLEALREWNRLAAPMTTCGLLTKGNVAMFAQYCQLHGSLIRAWQDPDHPPSGARISAFRHLAGALGLLRWDVAPPKSNNRFAKNAPKRTTP